MSSVVAVEEADKVDSLAEAVGDGRVILAVVP